jgi:phosphatidate cytidylyltransferase
MLGQRIITAIVLLAVLVPALAASASWPFLLLTLVLIAAAGWEWGRLNQCAFKPAVLQGALLAAACLGAWAAGWTVRAPAAVWWVAAGVWVLGGAVALRAGPHAWPGLPRAARVVLGLVALWAAWLALAAARSEGLSFILSVLCIVWVADIAAYAGGRTWGRRKLAPSISPGKSWEGAISGFVGVLLLALLWSLWETRGAGTGSSIFSFLAAWLGWGPTVLVLAMLTAMSVVGDLVESLAKRAAGAKDSSRLLPGHGGVLDRVDALLPTLPLAMAVRHLGGL